jgi:hypothetical protein
MLPLYCTMHLCSSNVTSHPALVKTLIPKSDVMVSCECEGEAFYFNVIHMCGHNLLAIVKQNFQWGGCWSFVNNRYTLHYKKMCCAWRTL